MSRDDIVELHFKGLVKDVSTCNMVMKRLRRDGYVDVNSDRKQFIYFHNEINMKRNSQKIDHFLGIVDVYKQLCEYEKPKVFDVEPKFGKGYIEPDSFVIWRRSPFYIEVQKSIYSDKVMKDKMNRYDQFYHSRKWMNESWQPKNNKFFPSVLIITEKKYDIETNNFRVFQAKSVKEFMESVK